MQVETDIPWSANAPYDPDEPAADEQDDQMADLGPAGMDFVPYCVMPHVERLLKVCLLPQIFHKHVMKLLHQVFNPLSTLPDSMYTVSIYTVRQSDTVQVQLTSCGVHSFCIMQAIWLAS